MMSPTRRRESGSALVVVLWSLALLAAVLVAVGATARTEARIARNAIDHARAGHACTAGIHRGIVWLLDPERRATLAADGRPHAQAFEEFRLGIAITDEGGKVDLNAAAGGLIAAAFVAAGLPSEHALRLADAAIDWRDADELRRPGGAESADYRRAGLDHGPRNAPFETVEEIRQLLGMDDEVFRRAAPWLTAHSGAPGVDPWTAPPTLLRALPGLDPAEIEVFLRLRAAAPPNGEQAAPLNDVNGVFSPSLGLGYTIAVSAEADGGARVQCAALIWLTGRNDEPYAVLSWRGP